MPVRHDPASYLRRVLRMNPLEQAEAVIAARNDFLGLLPVHDAAQAGREHHENRRQVHARLEKLRARFWTLQLPVLRRELDRLDVAAYPDLRLAADKLYETMDLRHEFPRLATHRKADPELFRLFKQVVVLPPRDAAPLKERGLSLAASEEHRGSFRRMVRMMQREFPELLELEHDWLTLVRDARPAPVAVTLGRDRDSERESFRFGDTGWEPSSWVLWSVTFVSIKIFVLCLRGCAQ